MISLTCKTSYFSNDMKCQSDFLRLNVRKNSKMCFSYAIIFSESLWTFRLLFHKISSFQTFPSFLIRLNLKSINLNRKRIAISISQFSWLILLKTSFRSPPISFLRGRLIFRFLLKIKINTRVFKVKAVWFRK